MAGRIQAPLPQVWTGVNPAYNAATHPPSAFGGYANHNRQPANGAPSRTNKQESFKEAVENVLGPGVVVKQSMSADIDLRQSNPHTTTSLQYALGGSASLVQVDVAEWLAGFQDPIKAILGVGVHREAKIIIKRKYIQGGGAMITPERAPARLVSVQEDVREVMLTRYGGDVEVNLNHFGIPEDAQHELDMKVNHQKRELERQLVNIGYETLMREGTMLQDAIVRSNPSITDAVKAQESSERITTRMLFGCTSKFAFPVQNILAACKYASAYSVSGRRGSVLVLPHGLPELLRYTKPDKMKYSISGLTQQETSKPIDMELDNVVVDPSTGVRIMTHIPQPTFQHGAVLEPEPSPLQTETTVRMMYKVQPGRTQLLDFSTGSLRTVTAQDIFKLLDIQTILDDGDIDNGGDGRIGDCATLTAAGIAHIDALDDIVIFRTVKFMMSSAILAVPGSNTGELLFAYPQTGVSTNIASESMLIKLRVYLGAALYQPEDVMIIPDVAFEGIVSGSNWINGKTWGMLSKRTKTATDNFINLRAALAANPAQPDPSSHVDIYPLDFENNPAWVLWNGGAFNYAIITAQNGPDLTYNALESAKKINMMSRDSVSNVYTDQSHANECFAIVNKAASEDFNDTPTVIYPGSTFNEDGVQTVQNAGHLNGLEDAKGWSSFFGNCGGQIYSNHVSP